MKSHTVRVRGPVVAILGAATLAMSGSYPATALAQPHARHAGPRGPAWHGDIERFHEHDWQIWRGGRWYHGPHAGRMGWWWIVAGVWYFYPSPVYPYPNPWEPPPGVYATPPGAAVPAPPPTPYWYYCESALKYYPYVATCPEGWKQVPATPPK